MWLAPTTDKSSYNCADGIMHKPSFIFESGVLDEQSISQTYELFQLQANTPNLIWINLPLSRLTPFY
jgi:hypothetical protein